MKSSEGKRNGKEKVNRYLADFWKTTRRKLQSFEWKGVKGLFLEPGDLQNHSNEEKGKEEKREKAMVAFFVFIMATLDYFVTEKKQQTKKKKKKKRWKQKVLSAVTFSKIRLDIHSYV